MAKPYKITNLKNQQFQFYLNKTQLVFMDIKKELQNRILVLDGAMGTMLQAYKFSEEDFRG